MKNIKQLKVLFFVLISFILSANAEILDVNQWTSYRGATVGGLDAVEKHSGTHSLKIINQDNLRSGWHYPTIDIDNKKTINFSGWNKAQDVSGGALNALDFKVYFADGSYIWYYPNELRFGQGTHDWKKIDHTKTFTKEVVSIKPYVILNYKQGTVWFDDISVSIVEEEDINTDWTPYRGAITGGVDTTVKHSGTHSLKIINQDNQRSGWHYPTIAVDNKKTITFSGWNKAQDVNADALNTLDFSINFADGTQKWYYPNELRFAKGTHDWEKVTHTKTFDKEVVSIKPYAILYYKQGTVWFDDITVKVEEDVVDPVFDLTSRKVAYDPFELIHADFVNMRGTASDWIGIFPVGADNQKASAIQWKYAKSLVNGALNFNGLAVGTYEMRAYFSTLHKKTIVFDVQDTAVTKIEYEDAEGGFDQVWSVWQNPTKPVTIINAGAAGSAHSIRAIKYVASYFSFSNPDKKLRFLEFDTRVGIASHVGNFGVSIKTKLGNRRIVFSSYMNHPGNVFHNDPARFAAPRTSNNGRTHNHPGPTDYYLETRNGNFIHYKINIEEKLRMLEPDNELLGMRYFTSAGGDFDNIQLVSH